jgi:hypothetical protein
MTDERFWEIVESVDWPVEDTDKAKVEILMNTAPAEVEELRNKMDETAAALRRAFEEEREHMDEDFYVSEDGLDDCVNHIVGLGYETFERELLSPSLIVERYREKDFTESFSYAIPYPTEYDKLGTDFYIYRSDRYVNQYDEIARNEKFSEDYRRKAMFMKETLEDFPQIRGTASYLQRHDMIDENSEDAVLDWMYRTEEELSDDINGWPVRNLVSDYRTYYIYNQ